MRVAARPPAETMHFLLRLCPMFAVLPALADWQRIVNPAYNADRGPVSIYGVRLHWEL